MGARLSTAPCTNNSLYRLPVFIVLLDGIEKFAVLLFRPAAHRVGHLGFPPWALGLRQRTGGALFDRKGRTRCHLALLLRRRQENVLDLRREDRRRRCLGLFRHRLLPLVGIAHLVYADANLRSVFTRKDRRLAIVEDYFRVSTN